MVNVNDINQLGGCSCCGGPEDRLILIFIRQRELMEKYEEIEAKNGLLQTSDIPVNLHCPKGQARLKDFAWRITEELAEALDAVVHSGEFGPHVKEEIADSLHFLVEMAILSDITAQDIHQQLPELGPNEDNLDAVFTEMYHLTLSNDIKAFIVEFVRQLGMVCHTLKNKPWKQSQMLTDETEYKKRFIQMFKSFIAVCSAFEMEAEDLFDLYFRKSEVNKFRQRSQY